MAVSSAETPSRTRILETARAEFAERGFDAARLQDIAGRAGLSHPTLLYHFNSKADLYHEVIESAVSDWARETEASLSTALRGFDHVASVIEAGFDFLATRPEFARILRREAMQGGERLDGAIADVLRPFLHRAIAFLEQEMAAGRLRRHDPLELIQICYAGLFTYFSDAAFRARLLGEDALAPPTIERHRRALTDLLRRGLAP